MDTLVDNTATSVPMTLWRLYYLRFAFAAVWAVLLFASAGTLGPLSVTLLLLYPLVDVAAAVVDVRSARASSSTGPALYANIAISSLAVIGLILATMSGIPAVLRVWGAWAIASGITQLVNASLRRKLGGQWAMIISGAISAIAGASFIAQAGSHDPSLNNLAGYAFLGGVFFLVSAFRLNRASRRTA